MEDFGKDLLCDIEEQQYGMYIGHNVVYLNEKLIKDPKVKYTVEPVTQEVAAHFYYVAKNTRELSIYDRIIRQKVAEEFGDNSDGSNRVTVASDSTKLHYCVVASEVDYSSQDVIQPDFSIKHKMEELATKPNRMNYFYYYSDLTQTMKEIGIYDNTEELKNNLLEDMVKANQMGYIKESVQEDTVGIDQYGFWMIPITIYETIPDGTGSALVEDYTIYFAAQNKEQTETYESIVKEKLLQEFNVEIIGGKRINQDKIKQWLADGQSRISVKTEWPTYCYSVVAASFDFSTQDMLQPDYSIKQNLKNITNPKGHVDYRFQKGLYSDLLLKAISVGIYKKEDEFKEYYFEDMVKMVQLGLDGNVTECCCAGGMGGGVTTASFAPAVTHTVYPKPGKKKSKKEDSDETIADVYSYYGCVVRLSLSFPGSDTKIRKYYVVLGKDLGQIDEFNQKINQNIKQISNDSCILSTTLTSMLYSTEIKDFDFEGQKILDSSLYVNDPKKFISNEKQLDQEEVQIRDIMGRSYDNLSDFTNDLFSQMTEDTDDNKSLDEIYGFYAGDLDLIFHFSKDGNVNNRYTLLAKTPEQFYDFMKIIEKNIKRISKKSYIWLARPPKLLYNTAIKDFDFDKQEILNSNNYVDNYKIMFENPFLFDDVAMVEQNIKNTSYNNLSDFTSDLFEKLTEDTDDVYWPVRNDETDAFEQEIRNQRQAKKDKIIARKEKTIEKRNQTLANWIARVGDTMNLVKMKSMIDNYNKTTAKHIMELERIKKLPIDSPEFL